MRSFLSKHMDTQAQQEGAFLQVKQHRAVLPEAM